MKSIGECMAIIRNFKESFQKAIRSLEIGLSGLNKPENLFNKTKKQLLSLLEDNRPNKFLIIAECLRQNISINKVILKSKYDPWFVREINDIVKIETSLKKKNLI